MLKTRIMPTILFKDVGIVKSKQFDSWRRIGTAMQSVKVYNMREVDELIFLDINATNEKRDLDLETIDSIADECFMPLTVGGGVKPLEDIKNLLKVGADKVAINSKAIESPDFIKKAVETFGSQCIIVSIDFKDNEVYTHSASKNTGKNPLDIAKQMESMGAGEILLTSINNDGMMTGYDLETTKLVSQNVSIPVIASGGAGNYTHMLDVLTKGGASAVSASSIFHFTEQTPKEAKEFLAKNGIPMRI